MSETPEFRVEWAEVAQADLHSTIEHIAERDVNGPTSVPVRLAEIWRRRKLSRVGWAMRRPVATSSDLFDVLFDMCSASARMTAGRD
jgi:hypothetical protein